MRQSSLTKMAAFVFITMNTLACFNNNNKSGQTASSTTLPSQTTIRYAINISDDYLDRKEENTCFYKVPPGTEVIITAILGGAKEDVEVGWNLRNPRLRGFLQQEARTWKYKATRPAGVTVSGEPRSQMTIDGIDKFVNEQKEFVIEWVALLEIGVGEGNLWYYEYEAENTMKPYFTVSLKNTSKDSIELDGLTFHFKLFFKEDYEMEPIVFKCKDISISETTLAKEKMVNITIGEQFYRAIDPKAGIPNNKNLDESKFREDLKDLWQGMQFEVLDQEGNVIGVYYE